MAEQPVKNNIFNAQSFTSLAMKFLPVVSTGLMYYGVVTKEQGAALVAGAPDFLNAALIVVGGIGNGVTVVWNFWKNRKTKRAADAAAIDGVKVTATPALAAAITAVAAPAAQSSIASK